MATSDLQVGVPASSQTQVGLAYENEAESDQAAPQVIPESRTVTLQYVISSLDWQQGFASVVHDDHKHLTPSSSC